MRTEEKFGIGIHSYTGTDGIPVLHLDTPVGFPKNEHGPILRVYLNDADEPVYANPSLTETKKESSYDVQDRTVG